MYASVQHLQASLKDLPSDIKEIRRSVEAIHKQNVLRQIKRAANSSWNENKEILVGTRVGTLRGVDEWIYDPNDAVFWLRDDAGTGKSTVAASVAKRAEELGFLGGEFFWDHATAELSKINLVCRTLLTRLIVTYPEIQPYILKALEENPNILTAPTATQFKTLLIDPLISAHRDSPRHFPLLFVFDALDECDSDGRRIFMEILKELKKVPMVKVFITSRRDVTKPELSNLVTQLKADVERSFTEETGDFEQYFTYRLRQMKLRHLQSGSQEEKELVKKLVVMSGRLFVWAKMTCDWIEDRDGRKRDLEDLLAGRDGVSLNQIYLRILRQACPSETLAGGKQLLNRLLLNVVRTIVASYELLTADVIAELLDEEAEDIRKVLWRLRSMFTVEENGPVRLAHPTVREFLLNKDAAGDFYVDESDHGRLASSCLNLLSRTLYRDMCQAGEHIENSEIKNLDERLEKFVGYGVRYAARYWPLHAMHAVDQVADLMVTFFQNRTLDWVALLSLLSDLANTMGRLTELQANLKAHVSRFCRIESTTLRLCVEAVFRLDARRSPICAAQRLYRQPRRQRGSFLRSGIHTTKHIVTTTF